MQEPQKLTQFFPQFTMRRVVSGEEKVVGPCRSTPPCTSGRPPHVQIPSYAPEDLSRLAKRATDFLEEFKQSRDHLAIPMFVGGCTRWIPPLGASFKINFDAAIFQDINVSGFGAIIQNGLGEVMASISAKGPPVCDNEEAEVLACRKALEFAMDAGFSDLVIEGDNATVMNYLSYSRATQSRLGHLYGDIHCLVAGLNVFSVNCVSRSANSVAHSLARFARCITDEVVWLEESPPLALEALHFDSY